MPRRYCDVISGKTTDRRLRGIPGVQTRCLHSMQRWTSITLQLTSFHSREQQGRGQVDGARTAALVPTLAPGGSGFVEGHGYEHGQDHGED